MECKLLKVCYGLSHTWLLARCWGWTLSKVSVHNEKQWSEVWTGAALGVLIENLMDDL